MIALQIIIIINVTGWTGSRPQPRRDGKVVSTTTWLVQGWLNPFLGHKINRHAAKQKHSSVLFSRWQSCWMSWPDRSKLENGVEGGGGAWGCEDAISSVRRLPKNIIIYHWKQATTAAALITALMMLLMIMSYVSFISDNEQNLPSLTATQRQRWDVMRRRVVVVPEVVGNWKRIPYWQ